MRQHLTSHARRVLAACVVCLVGLMAAVMPASAVTPSVSVLQSSRGSTPLTPVAPVTSPIALDLISLTPRSVTPGSTVTAVVEATNMTEAPIPDAALEFGMNPNRVTQRDDLASWSAQSPTDVENLPRGYAVSPVAALEPGKPARFTVSLPAEALSLPIDGSLWGPRRIALTIVSGVPTDSAPPDAAQPGSGEPVASLRTSLVWQPVTEVPQMDLTYLAPVGLADPAQVALDQEGFAQSLEEGPLAAELTIAQRPDVSWHLDPSVLTPLTLPTERELVPTTDAAATAPATDDGADAPSPSTTPTGGPSDSATSAETASETSSAPAASDGGGESAPADPTPTTSDDPTWQEPAAWASLRDRVTLGATEHDLFAAPYARADLAGLAAEGDDQPSGATDVAASLTSDAESLLDSAGITPAGTLIRLDGQGTTTTRAAGAQRAGADALLVPAESFFSTAQPTITPSGYTSLTTDEGTIPVLGYDTVLTDLASGAQSSDDPEVDRQRALAESALVAGQDTDARRHLLIAPPVGTVTDANAASALLDALMTAPWVASAPASTLVSLASNEEGTRQLRGSETTLWTGPRTELAPVGRTAAGEPTLETGTEAKLAPASTLDEPLESYRSLTALRSAMEDPRFASAAVLLAATGVTDGLVIDAGEGALAPTEERLGSPAGVGALTLSDAADTRRGQIAVVTEEQLGRVGLVMSESYNLVSSGSGIPLTLTNDFDTSLTLVPEATSSKRIVRVSNTGMPVTLAPRTSTEASIPIEAVTSGTVTLQVSVSTPNGVELTAHSSSLSVNPEWENWTTMILVILMGLLVVVGVLRARNRSSDARAPSVADPDDPPTSSKPSRTISPS